MLVPHEDGSQLITSIRDVQGRKVPAEILIRHPPSVPVVIYFELTPSRTVVTALTSFIARVLPPDAKDFAAV
jgi:hypothetical protein